MNMYCISYKLAMYVLPNCRVPKASQDQQEHQVPLDHLQERLASPKDPRYVARLSYKRDLMG